MLEKLKKEVYEANMELPKLGLVMFTWGNVSGIDRESGLVVIKPSGVEYDKLKPSDMVVVDLDGNKVEGEFNPSSDTKTHLVLYKKFPKIGGVVHTHSTYATAFSQAKTGLLCYGTTHADCFYGEVPCTRDMTAEEINGDYEHNTGEVITERFEDLNYEHLPAVLVASHGPFAWGKNAMDAVEHIAVLEECAKMAFLGLNINKGEEVSKSLLDKHFLRKHGENAYYGQKVKENDFSLDAFNKEDCACGRKHEVYLKKLIIKPDAVDELPQVIDEMGDFSKITMICDDNTYKVLGQKVEGICRIDYTIKLNPENLHANEIAVESVQKELKSDCDLLVAVGSGTIHDVTRYVAYQNGLQFISVPTAPSVDGFVSSVAAMTMNGVKATLTAVCPLAMVADSRILAQAPMRLIAAGVSDLLGKYTALADWKIGNILTGEYICDYLIELEEKAVNDVMDNIDEILKQDMTSVEKLMYGLVLSGLAMQMCGNSRPASGAEHHISHFTEMKVLNNPDFAYHGEKVGVGLACVCDEYKKISEELKEENIISEYKGIDEEYIRNMFGTLSDEILKENENDVLKNVDLNVLKKKIPEIKAVVDGLPSGEEIRDILTKFNAPAKLCEIGLKDEDLKTVLEYSPLVRNRLTLMRLKRLFV